MKIYMAGRIIAQERLRAEREILRGKGHTVDSHWLDLTDPQYPVPRGRALSEGFNDLRQVRAADLLIIDTLDESTTGGREVELGYFIGTVSPLFWRVGPVRNIFHEQAAVSFDSWDKLHSWMTEVSAA